MDRKRAFVMIYAVGTLVLVSSLALGMMEARVSDADIAKQRFYTVLARDAAESGIEYAMGFINQVVGRDLSGTGEGGPWSDPNFVFECDGPPASMAGQIGFPWMYAARAGNTCPSYAGIARHPRFPTYNQQAEGFATRLHAQFSDGTEAAACTYAQSATTPFTAQQFQISLTPELTYQNTRRAYENGNPTLFYLRSRGEVLLQAANPRFANQNPQVMASVYLMQTFYIAPQEGSASPLGRVVRQVLDREPANLTPMVNSAGPTRLNIPAYNQRLLPPNPH